MANYGTMVLTTQGLALFTKAQAGTAIVFTKMQVGSGSLGSINPQSLTALISPQFDVSISGIVKDTVNMMAYVSGTADNSAISTQLYVNELGLFATDPDVGEILYGYANAGTAGDYIPPSSVGLFTRTFTVNAAVGNAPNVTVVIPSNKYASLDSNGLVLSSELPVASATKAGVVKLSTSPPTGQPAVAVYEGDFAAHRADYVRQPGYAPDTGTANHIVMTLNPAPTSYVDGMGVIIKPANASTAATDINVNGLGVKNIVDSFGNAVTNFKANTIYSLKYEATSGNFIVQGKGGGGNATAEDLLSGKTATVDTGPITGTIPSKGTASYTPTTTDQVIAAGQYLSGTQTISGDPNLVTGNIKAGSSIFGVTGKSSVVDTSDANAVASQILAGLYAYVNGLKIMGTIPSKTAQIYTPGTTDQTIPAGQYLSGVQTIKGDSNLIAANILSGNSIFGVAGSYPDYQLMTASDNTLASSTTTVSTSSTSMAQVKQFRVTGPRGTIRVKFDLGSGNAGTSVSAQVYKNGVAVGTLRTTSSTTFVTYTEDISFSSGDYIQIYASTTSTMYGPQIKNYYLCGTLPTVMTIT